MKATYRIVVLGEGGVGKTALTIQLCLNHFIENYDPTIEDSYRKHALIDDEPCLIEILDTAGQEEYTALRDQWIREGDGFLIVYSITQRASFERIDKFKTQIVRVKDSESIPIVLVGNKMDKVAEREVSREDGQAVARQMQCHFTETSAKTRQNLEEAYFTVIRQIRAERGDLPSGNGGPGLNISGRRRGTRDGRRRCVIL